MCDTVCCFSAFVAEIIVGELNDLTSLVLCHMCRTFDSLCAYEWEILNGVYHESPVSASSTSKITLEQQTDALNISTSQISTLEITAVRKPRIFVVVKNSFNQIAYLPLLVLIYCKLLFVARLVVFGVVIQRSLICILGTTGRQQSESNGCSTPTQQFGVPGRRSQRRCRSY